MNTSRRGFLGLLAAAPIAAALPSKPAEPTTVLVGEYFDPNDPPAFNAPISSPDDPDHVWILSGGKSYVVDLKHGGITELLAYVAGS